MHGVDLSAKAGKCSQLERVDKELKVCYNDGVGWFQNTTALESPCTSL